MRYSVVNIEDIAGAGPGGAVRFVRRELGVEAFGINWFEIPPNGRGNEHDETRSGQEEVSIVVRGDGHWLVDGSEVPYAVRMSESVFADTNVSKSARRLSICPLNGPAPAKG